MNILTLIVTIEPATGKTMVRPACELYRSLEQATAQVLRREYKSGIATWNQGHANAPGGAEPD